jgi:hypothetical protein
MPYSSLPDNLLIAALLSLFFFPLFSSMISIVAALPVYPSPLTTSR